MFLALWNCISIPFIVAFTPESADVPHIFAISAFIDFIFLVDVILNFRTTYFHSSTGDEVFDLKKIAKKYVFGGRFGIDILATIPLDLLVNPLLENGVD